MSQVLIPPLKINSKNIQTSKQTTLSRMGKQEDSRERKTMALQLESLYFDFWHVKGRKWEYTKVISVTSHCLWAQGLWVLAEEQLGSTGPGRCEGDDSGNDPEFCLILHAVGNSRVLIRTRLVVYQN
jgi:hypothetical protein